jgi:hypothetical protein
VNEMILISPVVLGGVITLIVSVLGGVGVLIGHIWARLAAVEAQLKASTQHSHAMWVWARTMIDMYLTWRREGAPDPEPIPDEPTE